MNKANLQQPIVSDKVGPAPFVIQVITTPNAGNAIGGPTMAQHLDHYVKLSSLPDELRHRVIETVKILMNSI
jgi:hypothetical protein